VAKRKAWPTVESLSEIAAALVGCPNGTRLEAIVEPTGPAFLPIAVFSPSTLIRIHWTVPGYHVR
jgi:hypothetical protein